MGYKVLGYIVWEGGKWYARRRYSGASRRLALGGLAMLLIASALGGVAAQRKASAS